MTFQGAAVPHLIMLLARGRPAQKQEKRLPAQRRYLLPRINHHIPSCITLISPNQLLWMGRESYNPSAFFLSSHSTLCTNVRWKESWSWEQSRYSPKQPARARVEILNAAKPWLLKEGTSQPRLGSHQSFWSEVLVHSLYAPAVRVS